MFCVTPAEHNRVYVSFLDPDREMLKNIMRTYRMEPSLVPEFEDIDVCCVLEYILNDCLKYGYKEDTDAKT